jgi:hypothetical protein
VHLFTDIALPIVSVPVSLVISELPVGRRSLEPFFADIALPIVSVATVLVVL